MGLGKRFASWVRGLVSPDGRPIQPQKMLTEQATGSTAHIRNPYDDISLDDLNPLTLRAALIDARAGNQQAYIQIADNMERGDTNYFAALQVRKLAVSHLDYAIQPVDESPEELRIADDVRAAVFTPEFGQVFFDAMDALSKNFSVCEIMWDTSEKQWRPIGYKYRKPSWFFWDHETLSELKLDNGTYDGEQLVPYKYLIHTPKIFSGHPLAGGLARIAAIHYMLKGFAIKNWVAFMEVFGMPIRVGKYDRSAGEKDKKDLRRAVIDIGSDAAAIIPKEMEIEFVRPTGSGFAGSDQLFLDFCEWSDRKVTQAVLGQTLTADQGGSYAQSETKNRVRVDLLEADGRSLSYSIWNQIIRAYVDLNYGRRRRYPTFFLNTETPEDLRTLATILPVVVDRGLPVAYDTIYDRLGIDPPKEGQKVLTSVEIIRAKGRQQRGDDGTIDDESGAGSDKESTGDGE